jgi:hypothetical protein
MHADADKAQQQADQLEKKADRRPQQPFKKKPPGEDFRQAAPIVKEATEDK